MIDSLIGLVSYAGLLNFTQYSDCHVNFWLDSYHGKHRPKININAGNVWSWLQAHRGIQRSSIQGRMDVLGCLRSVNGGAVMVKNLRQHRA
jgi:hypothetical protein